jgi:pimeloyl-ACP methyl ester carboxylesterase
MPEWFSGDVVANGVRIHYSRTGGDKPPLVLSHGATDSGLCWTRVARALESDYDVILSDARGHGPVRCAAERVREQRSCSRPGSLYRRAGTTLRLVADYPDLASCAIL